MDPISITILSALLVTARTASGTLRAAGAKPVFTASPRPTDYNRRGILPQHYDFERPQQGAPACPLGRLDGSTMPVYMADCPDGFSVGDPPLADEMTDAQLLRSARQALPDKPARGLPVGHTHRQLAQRRDARAVLRGATAALRRLVRDALGRSPKLAMDANVLELRQLKAFYHLAWSSARLLQATVIMGRPSPQLGGDVLDDFGATATNVTDWETPIDSGSLAYPVARDASLDSFGLDQVQRNLAEESEADYGTEGAWSDAHLTLAARRAFFERRERSQQLRRIHAKYRQLSGLDAGQHPIRALLGWYMVGFQRVQDAHYRGLTYRTRMVQRADEMKLRRWPQAQRRAELDAMGPAYLFTRGQWEEINNRATATLTAARRAGIQLRPDNAALYSQWFEQWMADNDLTVPGIDLSPRKYAAADTAARRSTSWTVKNEGSFYASPMPTPSEEERMRQEMADESNFDAWPRAS